MASSKLQNALSFKRFLLRSEVLRLYRQIMKTLRHMPSEIDRQELMSWARHDFRKNKHETDEELIRMMLTRGRLTLKELSQTIPHRSST
ncbi:LYR motif-containing protein 2 [Lamellibrachia satsuma]|nr:LYR motif-containing protein 2 [Lamellibrachia satsuma]